MSKKSVFAGLVVAAAPHLVLATPDESDQALKETMDLIDQVGLIELEACEKLLHLEQTQDISSIQRADRNLLKSLIGRISESPIQYCQDKVLMSQVRVTEDKR